MKPEKWKNSGGSAVAALSWPDGQRALIGPWNEVLKT